MLGLLPATGLLIHIASVTCDRNESTGLPLPGNWLCSREGLLTHVAFETALTSAIA